MKSIYIYYQNDDVLLGTVYVDFIRGKEIYSFEYSDYALTHNLSNILLDKEIAFSKGRQYKTNSSEPYRFLLDLAPDRWGRNLIKRKISQKTLNFSDYLVNVSDVSRMGALRIKEDLEGPFVLDEKNIPPFKFIKELEHAAYYYDGFSDDDEWKILLSPGSSLGGARPKSSIYSDNGELYLAKFTHKNDEYDISKVEYFTYLLAREVGINFSGSRLIEISSKRSVFLTKRFDREKELRIHYVSFMTILGADEGDSSNYSYLDVAEAVTRLSTSPNDDLLELFKRIAFFIMVHNYDDHLRNIGMLFVDNGYRLSPCFDVNMVFYNSHPTLSIDNSDDYSLENLINHCKYFNLKKDDAISLVDNMRKTIKNSYKRFASECKLEKNLIDKINIVLG